MGYPNLAKPLTIGSVTSKNRLMKNGTGFFWDDPETGSFMNQRYLDYFEALAKGGTGLISSCDGAAHAGPRREDAGLSVSPPTSTSPAGRSGARCSATVRWRSPSCSSSAR